MQLPGAMLRRNGGSADIPIGNSGEVIPAGSYAAYPVADAHMDPALYPDAHSFDPGRYLGSKPKHQEGPHTYLGWGSGRHVCGE
jgi:sterol 14-demethylase